MAKTPYEVHQKRGARFKVVTWHGEARSLFYVVDTKTNEIVQTEENRGLAERWCVTLETNPHLIP